MTKSMKATSVRVRVNLPARMLASVFFEPNTVQAHIEPRMDRMANVQVVRKKNRIYRGPKETAVKIFNRMLDEGWDGTLSLK